MALKFTALNVGGGESGVPIEVAELPTPTAEDVGKVYLNTTDGEYYVCGEIAGSSLAVGEPLGSVIFFDTSVNIADLGIPAGGMFPVIAATSDTANFMIIVGELLGGGEQGTCYTVMCGDMDAGIPSIVYVQSDVLTVDQFNEMLGSQIGLTITEFGWQTDVLDTSAFADCIVQENYVAEAGNLVSTGTIYSLQKANEEYYSGVITDLQGKVSSLTVEKNVLQEQYDEVNKLAILVKDTPQLYVPDNVTLESKSLETFKALTKLSVPSIENRFYSLFGNKTTSVPSSLETVEIRGGDIVDNGFLNCNGIKSVTINAATVGAKAFAGCSSLKSITIGNNVTSIGSGAWNYVNGIKDVYAYIDSWLNISFNGSEPNKQGQESILHILDSNGNEITELIIPDSVTNIGDFLFEHSRNLRSVTIPDTVTSIGRYAFELSGITSVIIGNGVTSIGQSAFSHCNGLTSVTIGSGVTSIGKYAFNSCSNLVRIIIPDSIKTIGDAVFLGLHDNPYFVIKAIAPPTISINSFQTPCTMYVPLASVEAYKSATNWSARAVYIRPYVATVEELANIDGTTYDKACVGADYIEYTYNGTSWELYTR